MVAAEVQVAGFTGTCQPQACGVEYGGIRHQDGLLCHIGDAHAPLNLKCPVVGLLHRRQYLQQGRLASAIAANQPDALLGLQ